MKNEGFFEYEITTNFLVVCLLVCVFVGGVRFSKEPTQQHIVKSKYSEELVDIKKQTSIQNIKMYIEFLSYVEFEEAYLNELSNAFYDASILFDVDSRELVAMAWHESRFISNRTSVKGARGIMQIMPFWVKDKNMSLQTGLKSLSDLDDPRMNILAGAYVYDLYRTYWKSKNIPPEDVRKIVLLSYNRGYVTVLNQMRKGNDPSNGYYKIVTNKRKKLDNLKDVLS